MNTRYKYLTNFPDYTPMEENEPLLNFYTKEKYVTRRNTLKTSELISGMGCATIFNTNPFILDDYYHPPTFILYKSQEKSNDYIKYYQKFLTIWKEKKNYFNDFTSEFVFDNFKAILLEFLKISPKYLTFNITNNTSIFFQSEVSGFNIYFELYFDIEFKDSIQSVVTIFKDKKPIIAFEGSFHESFKKIRKYTSEDNIFFETAEAFQQLSGTTNPQTEIQNYSM
jgi:hypothetical protein